MLNESTRKEKIQYTMGLIAVGLFFLFIFRLVPVTHDAMDSRFYYQEWGGIIPTVFQAIYRYFTINGRILATVVCGFAEQNDLLLDLCTTALMIFLVWTVTNRLKKRKKAYGIVVCLAMLLNVSMGIRVEVYFYAMLFYMIGIVLAYIALDEYEKLLQETNANEKKAILLIVLACAWIENVSVGIVVAITILDFFYLVVHHKLKKALVYHWVAAMITTFLMLLSTVLTGTRELVTNDTKLYVLVFQNATSLLKIIVYDEPLLWLMLAVVAVLYGRKKWHEKKWGKCYSVVISIYIVLFGLLLVKQSIFAQYVPNAVQLLFTIGRSTFGDILLLAIFTFGFLCLVLPLLLSSNKYFSVALTLAGTASLAPSLLTPNNIGARICSFFVIALLLCYVPLWVDLIEPERLLKITLPSAMAVFLLFIGLDHYFIYATRIADIQNERMRRIEICREEQLLNRWSYDNVLILPVFSEDQLYGTDGYPIIDPHYPIFLRYYGLNPDTLVSFSNIDDSLRVDQIGERTYRLTFIHAGKAEDYTYDYVVCDYNSVFLSSGATSESTIVITIPQGVNAWFFRVDVSTSESNNIMESVKNPQMYGNW